MYQSNLHITSEESFNENEEQTVYQYYTIVSEEDALISSQTDESDDLAYVEDADPQSKVMYLSLEQGEEEAYAPDVVLNGACEEEDEDETAVANIKFITMEDGQMYMTDSTSIDDNFKFSEYENGGIQCDNEDISMLTEEEDQGVNTLPSTSDNETEFPGNDFRRVRLEDGTCAYIDKSLWHSLLDNIEEEEEEEKEKIILPAKKEKKYHCTYFGCNKVYTTAHHLTVHTRNHTGNRPYQCSEIGCDKAFATGYSLKAHLRTHTGESPYGCRSCPKQFKTSGDLQKHVRTHTGEKPFKCPIEGCGRSFTTSNIRKVHIRSHTGERPYACTFKDCGKAFASATNYKNHMRIHSGEKPYQCNVPGCEKRFTEYSSLFKHNAVHKPLKCEYCGQLYKHKTTLRVHKQAMHKVMTTEDGREIRLKDGEEFEYLMVKNAK